MKSIIYVGMDVHKETYSMCCYSMENQSCFAEIQIESEIKAVMKYLRRVQANYGAPCEFVCAYEAGCIGYSLYHELAAEGVECVIMAPTTMHKPANQSKKKNDRRDARLISQNLAYNTYKAVHVPTIQDDAIKEYIRMRNNCRDALKATQQHILAFLLRHNLKYSEGKKHWTPKHLVWLRKIDLGGVLQETLDEYVAIYYQERDKLDRLNERINELSKLPEYLDRVKRLCCFKGIAPYTALSTIVEIGDFSRFPTAKHFSAYLGLVPGEKSSGSKEVYIGLTKAGNATVRTLMVEAAQSICRGNIGFKSKLLQSKQAGSDPSVIAYADKARERLQRKFHKLRFSHCHNAAIGAVARELSCFVWGMMTDRIV